MPIANRGGSEILIIEAAKSERWPNSENLPLMGPHSQDLTMLRMRPLPWQFAAHSGCEETIAKTGLRTYPGLPHRMERVREKDGVLFVNDSKATNPTATAPALAAFPSIRWILGGQAKTDNLDECAPHFGHVRSAYTIGEAGELFARLLEPAHAGHQLRNA